MPLENVRGAEVGWRTQRGTVRVGEGAGEGSVKGVSCQVSHGLKVSGAQMSPGHNSVDEHAPGWSIHSLLGN